MKIFFLVPIILFPFILDTYESKTPHSDTHEFINTQKTIFIKDIRESILSFDADSLFIPEWIRED